MTIYFTETRFCGEGKQLCWVKEECFRVMVWGLQVAHNGQSELPQFIPVCVCIPEPKVSQ